MKPDSTGTNRRKAKAGLLAISLTFCLLSACGNDDSAGKPPQGSEAAASPITDKESELAPQELPTAMLNGQYSSVYSRFSEAFKQQVSEADFTAASTEFTAGIESFDSFSRLQLNGIDEWIWLSSLKDKGVSAVFDEQEEIIGMQILELSSFPETDEALSETVFSLPFQGEWLVFWGGTNVFANYHYAHESQRYAYDFIQAKDGYSYKGDPSKNESYFVYGQEIMAPADGTVVAVVNDIADNEPVGVMNEKDPAGNVVIIEHGGEYSISAHLKKGSITVKPGDTVKKGEPVGKAGNSGNSSEPHLHFQVSDGQDLFASRSINVNWDHGINAVRGQSVTAE